MRGLRSLHAPSLCVTLLGCYVVPLCAQTVPKPQKESETIRGTVVNSVTHAPIGRALVSSADNRFATLTDSSGHFEFRLRSNKTERRSDGPLEVTEEGPGSMIHLGARKPGFLPEKNSPFTDVRPGQKGATIYLVPAGIIVGHVTVADSESPERIWVEIYSRQVQNGRAGWTSAGTVATWSDGQFRFSELYPGTYKVFTHERMDRDPLTFDPRGPLYGYPPVYFPGANNFAAGTAVQLGPGVTFDADLSPARRQYYPVSIGVANTPEGPISIGVEVSPGGQGGPGYSLGYNPRAHAIQGWLPDGAYTVEVWTYGQPGASGTAEISVPSAAAAGYSLTLIPNTPIHVNVAEEFTSTQGPSDGAQVEPSDGRDYVQVRLEAADELGWQRRFGGAVSRQPAAAEGTPLMIEHITPGRYWLHVDSGRGFAASIKCGDTDLLRQPLVVPPGGLSDPIEVVLRDDFAQIDGFVVERLPAIPEESADSAEQTPPHIYLIPLPDSTGQFKELWVAPDGKFSDGQIPPGDYQVLAFARPQQNLEYRNQEAMRKYESLGQEVRLAPGQVAHLQLHLISGSE